jgi:hypothetical protein
VHGGTNRNDVAAAAADTHTTAPADDDSRQSSDASAGGSTELSTPVIASLCGIAIVFVIALIVIFHLCRPKPETEREEQNLMAGCSSKQSRTMKASVATWRSCGYNSCSTDAKQRELCHGITSFHGFADRSSRDCMEGPVAAFERSS